MEKNKPKALSSFSDEKRMAAVKKFKIIEPNLIGDISLKEISQTTEVSLRSLQRWKKAYEDYGLIGLITKERIDSGEIKISVEVEQLIRHHFLSKKHLSIKTVHRRVSKECNNKKWAAPSYQQVYRYINSMPTGLITLAHDGKKIYSEKHDLIYIRESERPNEIWQADHTLLDIHVLDEKEKVNRPWLTIILDDYSRSIAGFSLSFQTPTAIATALTLHQAIWKKGNANWPICGIPENFYTDHGSDFTSNHLEQVALDLRMNLIFSKIGVPRGRGKIERFFNTINLMLLEDLPGYTKHTNKGGLLTFQQLEEKLITFILDEYHHNIHSSTNKPPIISWNSSGFLPNMPESLEQLDLLLLQVSKSRKVHADGIHFQGLRYINSNLAAFVGESVLIRYNPNDLAEIRVFFNHDYICTAISPEISNLTVDIKDITNARNKRKQSLKKDITIAETLKNMPKHQTSSRESSKNKNKLKRYFNE